MPRASLICIACLVCLPCVVQGAAIIQPADWATLRVGGELRQALSWRVERRDPVLIANTGLDDGNRNFSRGLVSSRSDGFAEVDANLADLIGVRISAAAWYDHLYERPLDNDSIATSNHLNDRRQVSLGLSNVARRFGGGPNIELLDALMSSVFDLGQIPTSIKIGRFAELSGEALFASGAIHGASYGQVPLDIAKAVVSPGASVDELFLPLNGLAIELEPIDGWAIRFQYTADWEPYRLPEAGVYLGASDAIQEGGESVILADGTRLVRRRDERGKNQAWSIDLSYFPDFIDGIFRIHYRRFSDVLPQVTVDSNAPDDADCSRPEVPNCSIVGQYRFVYPRGISLVGLSLSTALGPLSLGAELNARFDMPLVSDPSLDGVGGLPDLDLAIAADVLGMTGLTGAVPPSGQSGAVGDTLHLLINLAGFSSGFRTAGIEWFDNLAYGIELTASTWTRVTQREDLFRGRTDYSEIDRVSRENFAVAFRLEPVWSDVWNGFSLSAPMSVSVGVSGNSAVLFGGSEGDGNYALGLAVKARGRYSAEFRYSDFFGRIDTDGNGVAVQTSGAGAALSDRGMLSLLLSVRW